MRVMAAMESGDRFGITFTGLGLDQHALLEMRLEYSLQRDEEGGAVVAVPVGEAAGHDLGIVDLHLHLRVARQRGVQRLQQQVAVKAVPRRHEAVELELEILVVVGARFHPWHVLAPCR